MRILVAGATGAVGSRLVLRLVEAGHAVTGLTRSSAKVEALRKAGAAATVVEPSTSGPYARPCSTLGPRSSFTK
jgi:nucleoside-diphosphate-sugar epimerase